MVPEGVLGPGGCDEVCWHQLRALMQELEEGVLAIGPRLTPQWWEQQTSGLFLI